MNSVIYIDAQQGQKEKPVKFTHYLNGSCGWEESDFEPNRYEKVVYLGECAVDGDMFAAYKLGFVLIFKGHLNSGKY